MPESGNPIQPEWTLLLACCASQTPQTLDRIRTMLQQPVRWASVIALADQHGTTSLLYECLARIGEEIPGDEIRPLKQRYQTNLHKALLVAKELIRILERLEVLGVEVMPYKGVALAETVYGDIALRQPGDIDLLIRPEDWPRIKDAVRELGYTPHAPLSAAEERAYLRSGYECAFDSATGRNLLEVQWALQPRFYAVDIDMEGLFQRAVTVTVAGRRMKTPSPEDLLLVLSLHAAKHVWNRLIWLCDIARIVNLPNLDWDRILSQARELGIVRILGVTLLLANCLLETAIPTAVESELSGDRMASALADKIAPNIAGRTSYDTESLAYFRLMMRLRERRRDRVRFLQRLTFTPGPGEWSAVRLPASLFPLYRLVRLSRVAVKLARI
jgi:hypothetical protein